MTDFTLSVPASNNEVTKEWLQAVLASSFPDATFVSLRGNRIGEIYGFASRIYRYQWRDHGSPQSVVVKIWDTDSPAGIGEVLFFQTFREVGARVPRCFHSAIDKDKKKAVLVLEDLKDVIQGDCLNPLDLEQSKAVARSLARLHVAWLDHPKLAELSWIPDVSTWKRESDWFHSRRTLFLERFPEYLSGLARSLLDKIEFAPEVANGRLKGAPLSLLHGDFQLDNILFSQQNEPVFLDWSHPVKGATAFNLVPLLIFMTPLQNYVKVFDCYFGEFNELSRSPQNRTGLERQLGGEFLRTFARSTCGIARWQPELERGVQIIEAGIKQLNTAVDFWHSRDPELFSFLY